MTAEQREEKAVEIFWKGKSYQDKNDHKTAILLFSKALELKPHYLYALELRAKSSIALKQYQPAVTDCTEALQTNPSRPGLYHIRATAHFAAGDYRDAIADYDDLILLGTGDKYNPKLYRGLAYGKLEQFDNAIADLKTCIDQFPDYLPDLAQFHLANSQYVEAIKCCTLAIHRHLEKIVADKKLNASLGHNESYAYGAPDYRDYRAQTDNRIHVNFRRTEFEERVRTLLAKFSAEPYLDAKLARLYYARGSCLLAATDTKHALVEYADGLKLSAKESPEYAQGMQLLTKARDSTETKVIAIGGGAGAATESHSRRIEEEPKNAEGYARRGEAYMTEKNPEKALSDLTQAIRIDPHNKLALSVRANYYLQQKDYQKAAADLTALIAADPEHQLTTYEKRATVWRALGDKRQAATDYFEVLRLESQDFSPCRDDLTELTQLRQKIEVYNTQIKNEDRLFNAFCNRGSAYVTLQEYDKAIADLVKAHEMNPRNYTPLGSLAEAYLGKGDYANAARINILGIREHDSHSMYYTGLAEAYYKNGIYQKAINQYQLTLKKFERAAPTDAYAGLAEIYLNCPDEKIRDPKQALEFAKKAASHSPELLAAAHAANGHYQAAVKWQSDALQKSVKSKAPGVAKQLAEYMALSPGPSKTWPRTRLLTKETYYQNKLYDTGTGEFDGKAGDSPENEVVNDGE